MTWTAPRTWVAGETVTAALLNTHVRDNLKAIGDPWTTYTPAYVGISAIGNATVTAKYLQAGKLVIGEVRITIGSTTTFAAANLSISLPVAPAVQPNAVLGSVYMQDTSAPAFRTGVAVTGTTGLTTNFIVDGGAGAASNTVPWAWANTDVIAFSFTYEAA